MKALRIVLLILGMALISIGPEAANTVTLGADVSAGTPALDVVLTGDATTEINIVSYSWGFEIEDIFWATFNVTPATQVSDVTAAHDYGVWGDYVATFRVTDASDNNYSATQEIAVYSPTPTITPTSTITATSTQTPTPTGTPTPGISLTQQSYRDTSGEEQEKITLDWIADSTGEATVTSSRAITGTLARVGFKNLGASEDAYSVTINDSDGFDILIGAGVYISGVTETLTSFSPVSATKVESILLESVIQANITSATDRQMGQIILWFR